MESEERPAKMRKTSHTADHDGEPLADVEPVAGETGTPRDTAGDEQPSTANEPAEGSEDADGNPGGEVAKSGLSKNQRKKQARLERWEAGREDRKLKRKEKIQAKKERKREAFNELRAKGETPPSRPPRHSEGTGTQVPITVIFDCDFQDLMFDNEMKSLGLQITRCYSDNRKAPFRCHLAVSSFGGKMKERFDGILAQQYMSWKGFRFFEEDFVHVAEQSKTWMKSRRKGVVVAGALEQGDSAKAEAQKNSDQGGEEDDATKKVKSDDDAQPGEEGEVVYLSSESDNVLDRLKPNSTYIIGGLVDKNRHKGICHRRAMSRGIKTAKLPIGAFLQMKSRQVLVTNHVLEIMLKWLEFGDWGKAFMEVIPKRKGGVLKGGPEDGDAGSRDDNDSEIHPDGLL